MLSNLYHEILYRPLLNLLVFLYNIFGDFGIAIIIVTVIVRVILYPIAKKTLEHQKALKKIQPKIKELQEKHKGDKEKLSIEMMSLYKEHNFNPASGCLPMIVQLIVLIALYRVFINVINLNPSELYNWVSHPEHLNTHFFGLIDLGQKSVNFNFSELAKFNLKEGIKVASFGGLILAIAAGASQFYQTKISILKREKSEKESSGEKIKAEKKNDSKTEEMPDMTEIMNKQMLYFFPLLTVYIGLSFPAGLSLYWTVSTLLLIGQQWLLEKEDKKNEELIKKNEEKQ